MNSQRRMLTCIQRRTTWDGPKGTAMAQRPSEKALATGFRAREDATSLCASSRRIRTGIIAHAVSHCDLPTPGFLGLIKDIQTRASMDARTPRGPSTVGARFAVEAILLPSGVAVESLDCCPLVESLWDKI
jgi:hypothetical protein